MTAYKTRLNAEIQALRTQNNGNPTPAQLRRIDLLTNRKKFHVQKEKRVRRTKQREQRRAKDAVLDADAPKGPRSPKEPVTDADATKDSPHNSEDAVSDNDMPDSSESPGPSLQHPKAKPENLRLPTPAPKTSSPSPSPTPRPVSLFKGGKFVGKWSMEDGAMVDEDEANRDE